MSSKGKTALTLLFAATVFYSAFSVTSTRLGDQGVQEVPLTTDPDDQVNPALYREYVVWQDKRNGNWDIYGYNLETHQEFQITTNPAHQKNPAIYNDIVVWEDYRGEENISEFSHPYAIYGYNLSTREEFQIITTPDWMQTLAKKYNPAIYNDIVVWEDRGITTCTIAGITLSEGELFQVPETPDAQKWPAIYNDIVVWQDARDLGTFIYGLNLSTGEEFQIGTDHMVLPTYRKSAPAIHENTVIWTATSNYIIYAYDLVTSQESVIATASMKKCYLQIPHRSACDDLQRPQIFKDIIVWVDCRNENEDIYGYNLSTDQEFQVIIDEYSQCSPALYEDFVVWQDNRNGNWDIYGMYITPPLVITSFRSRTWVILDFFEPLLFWALLAAVAVAPCVLLVYLVYLYWYWHVKKVRYTEAPSSVRPKDFERNAVSTTPIGVLAVITVFIGCFYVISSDFSSGLIFSVVLAFSCVIYYFWSRRTPYIRLTTDEIMIFRSIGRTPTVVNLGSIKSVNVQTWVDIPYRIDVSGSDNIKQPEEYTTVHIGILSLKERDKAELIQMVTQIAD